MGENPVSSFREKLEAAAPRTPGSAPWSSGSTAPAAAWEPATPWPRSFAGSGSSPGKPVVACAHGPEPPAGPITWRWGPTWSSPRPAAVTGGVGALVNHFNLREAMAQLNVVRWSRSSRATWSTWAPLNGPLADDGKPREVFKEMVEGYAERFRSRVVTLRPSMTPQDRDDGLRRSDLIPAPKSAGVAPAVDKTRLPRRRHRRRRGPDRPLWPGRGRDVRAGRPADPLDLLGHAQHAAPGRPLSLQLPRAWNGASCRPSSTSGNPTRPWSRRPTH